MWFYAGIMSCVWDVDVMSHLLITVIKLMRKVYMVKSYKLGGSKGTGEVWMGKKVYKSVMVNELAIMHFLPISRLLLQIVMMDHLSYMPLSTSYALIGHESR